MKKPQFRQLPLALLVTIAIMVSGVLISAIIIAIQYNGFKNELRDELRNRLFGIATISAIHQDGDVLSKVSAGDDEFYRKIKEQNLKTLQSDPDLMNVYAIRKNEQGILLIVHASRTGDYDITEFGQPYEQPSQILEENFDTLDQTIIGPDFNTTDFGTYISAYAPIYNSSGIRTGILGIDIDATSVLAKERDFLYRGLIIFLLFLPIIAILGYITGRQLSLPFTELANNVKKTLEGNFKERISNTSGSREAAALAAGFNSMGQRLETQIANLENQVAEQTNWLEKRSSQLHVVSSIARTITSLPETSALLSETTNLISNLLGYYHVGIFLLDDKGENALLSAANSEGGKRMLERQYKLRLDTSSIVGFAISRGEPSIVRNIGTEAAFKHPYLPDTRSEFAFPLRIDGHIIGALDVHSREADAFSEENITTLTTVADQIATAIENARLSKDASEAIRESKEAVAHYIEREWGGYVSALRNKGYLFDGTRTIPLGEKINLDKNRHLPQTGKLTLEKETSELLVPIRLRGQIIGFINAKTKSDRRRLTKDDIDLLEAAAERTALTLENARLIETAQRRALHERTIGEISAKLGAVSDIDAIMQTAVEELGRRISGTAEVEFELEDET